MSFGIEILVTWFFAASPTALEFPSQKSGNQVGDAGGGMHSLGICMACLYGAGLQFFGANSKPPALWPGA